MSAVLIPVVLSVSAVVVVPIVLSALAIAVTIVIAIINIKNSSSKEDKDEAKELTEAVSEIRNVKETCQKISDDVKGMNQNILLLTREIATEQANHANLEKRVDRLENELREVIAAHS